MRQRLLFVCAVVSLLALPAAAGTVNVGTVTATQYEYPYFVAVVHASGTAQLTDIHLLVNGTTVVQPDKVQATAFDPNGTFTSWTIYKYATGVVKPFDTLTAVVRDVAGDSGETAVNCTTGSTKRKSRENAVCR